MMMFDNAVFASLIPQFLMVLGVLSCIIAPFLQNYTDNESAVFTGVVENVVIIGTNEDALKSDISIAFFSDFQQTFVPPKPEIIYPLIGFIHFAGYRQYTPLLCKANYLSLFFSRPPPFQIYT